MSRVVTVEQLEADGPRTSWPRLMSRKLAASYFSVSEREIDRLIEVGALSKVRLPVSRNSTHNIATKGESRRVLIDRLELDDLCERSREKVR